MHRYMYIYILDPWTTVHFKIQRSISPAMVLIVGHSQAKYLHEYIDSSIVTLSYPGFRIDEIWSEIEDIVPSFKVNNKTSYTFNFARSKTLRWNFRPTEVGPKCKLSTFFNQVPSCSLSFLLVLFSESYVYMQLVLMYPSYTPQLLYNTVVVFQTISRIKHPYVLKQNA